jgi:hypothetical protein
MEAGADQGAQFRMPFDELRAWLQRSRLFVAGLMVRAINEKNMGRGSPERGLCCTLTLEGLIGGATGRETHDD